MRLSLNDPEGWEEREGYMTVMKIQYNPNYAAVVHLHREDVEAFVKQAAEQYGIMYSNLESNSDD